MSAPSEWAREKADRLYAAMGVVCRSGEMRALIEEELRRRIATALDAARAEEHNAEVLDAAISHEREHCARAVESSKTLAEAVRKIRERFTR